MSEDWTPTTQSPERSGWYFVRYRSPMESQEMDTPSASTEFYDAENQWWCGTDPIDWMAIPGELPPFQSTIEIIEQKGVTIEELPGLGEPDV